MVKSDINNIILIITICSKTFILKDIINNYTGLIYCWDHRLSLIVFFILLQLWIVWQMLTSILIICIFLGFMHIILLGLKVNHSHYNIFLIIVVIYSSTSSFGWCIFFMMKWELFSPQTAQTILPQWNQIVCSRDLGPFWAVFHGF